MAAHTVVGVFPLLLTLLLGGGTGLPLSVPPLPEEPLLARVAPEECLFYMALSGMAEPDSKSRNQTEQLLAEPEVQTLVSAIERAIVRAATAEGKMAGGPAEEGKPGPREGEKGRGGEGENRRSDLEAKPAPAGTPQAAIADAIRWGKFALTRPLAVFVSSVSIGLQGPDIQAGAVLNAGAEADNLKAALLKYQKMLPVQAEEVEVAGVACYQLTVKPGLPPVTWGIKGKSLLVGVGKGAIEGMIKRAAGEPPVWLAELRKQLPVERVSTVTYVNTKKIIAQFAPLGGPQLTTVLNALGLGNVTSLASVTGLDGESFLSRTLVGIEGEPAGVFQLAAAKPLTAKDLAPIPHDATIAAAARLAPDDALALVLKIAGKIDPEAERDATQGITQLEDGLGINLRDDLLKPLGDVWCVYNAPSEGGFVITGLTAVVPVKDHKRLAAMQAKLLARFKAAVSQEAERAPGAGRRRPAVPKIGQFQFAGQEVYFLSAGRFDELPFATAWCLTEKELIVAAFPQQIKSYLSRGAEFKSLAASPAVARLFEDTGGPLGLTYVDTARLLEVAYPLLNVGAHALTIELRREGIDLDLSLLPTFGAIERHLKPSIGVLRRTAAGIEVQTRGTLPSSGIGAVLPVMLFGVRTAHFEAPAIPKAVP